MKTNTLKLFSAALFAHLMCLTVVLSHLHAKDITSMLNQQSNVAKLAPGDISAKALGDLHHHIDKAGLKNVHTDMTTTAARVRDLKPLASDETEASLGSYIHDFVLRLRVVASLCFQYA